MEIHGEMVLVEAREPKYRAILYNGSEENLKLIKSYLPQAYLLPINASASILVVPSEKGEVKAYRGEVILISSNEITTLSITQFSNLFYVTDEPETINS